MRAQAGRHPRAGAGTPRGCGSTHPARCATPTPGAWTRGSPGQQLVERRVRHGRGSRRAAGRRSRSVTPSTRPPADEVDVADAGPGRRPRRAAGCCGRAASGRTPRGSRRACRTTNADTDSPWSPTSRLTVVRSFASPGSWTTYSPGRAPGSHSSSEASSHRRRHASAARAVAHGATASSPAGAGNGCRRAAERPQRTVRDRARHRRRAARRRWRPSRTGARARPPPRRGVGGAAGRRAGPAERLAQTCGSWPSTSTPVAPSATAVGRPPTRAATTGVPQACASTATSPNDSLCEGTTTRSAARYQSASSARLDRRGETDDVRDARARSASSWSPRGRSRPAAARPAEDDDGEAAAPARVRRDELGGRANQHVRAP